MNGYNYFNEKIEREGKTFYRFSFGDSIQEWNLNSGVLLRTLQHSPPRNIHELQSSPDGKQLLTDDAVPGTYYKNNYPLAMTLWNAAAETYRTLPHGIQNYSVFSPDSKYLAAAFTPDQQVGNCKAIKIFDCVSLKETATVTIPPGYFLANPEMFLCDNSILVGCLHYYPTKGDHLHFTSSIKFWDTTSGRELTSIPAPAEDIWLTTVFSPDKKMIAAICSNGAENNGQTMIIDAGTHLARIVDYGEGTYAPCVAFHPSGKWLAVGTTHYNELLEEKPVEQRLQPRIQIVDVNKAEIAETIISPQAIMSSLAFSPDGKTLATSGDGEVLLWDFDASPGQAGSN
ncbi:MAG: PD40 domain-containing protein [Pirellulales bacterium]|nr:PD40 domain-containing protein [Pirellulales bacterium]